jgi:hypothetical protein
LEVSRQYSIRHQNEKGRIVGMNYLHTYRERGDKEDTFQISDIGGQNLSAYGPQEQALFDDVILGAWERDETKGGVVNTESGERIRERDATIGMIDATGEINNPWQTFMETTAPAVEAVISRLEQAKDSRVEKDADGVRSLNVGDRQYQLSPTGDLSIIKPSGRITSKNFTTDDVTNVKGTSDVGQIATTTEMPKQSIKTERPRQYTKVETLTQKLKFKFD